MSSLPWAHQMKDISDNVTEDALFRLCIAEALNAAHIGYDYASISFPKNPHAERVKERLVNNKFRVSSKEGTRLVHLEFAWEKKL